MICERVYLCVLHAFEQVKHNDLAVLDNLFSMLNILLYKFR